MLLLLLLLLSIHNLHQKKKNKKTKTKPTTKQKTEWSKPEIKTKHNKTTKRRVVKQILHQNSQENYLSFQQHKKFLKQRHTHAKEVAKENIPIEWQNNIEGKF